MTALMLILVFLTSYLMLTRISLGFSQLERVGFALPVGMSAVTLLMMLMDWANIGLNRASMTIVTLLLLIASASSLWTQRKPMLKQFKPQKLNWNWFNLVWVLMMLIVCYFETINISKCLIYPTFDRDSMAAFDTIGYVCAQEHSFHGMSIFQADYFPRMHEEASSMSYLPMIQLSYAYVYIFGATTSKAIPAFMYLSFLVGLYGACRRRLNHTASAFVLLAVILTPEMTAFASHSITNVMQAAMASTGIIYTCVWVNTKEKRDLHMAIILLAANSWMRAEGILFVGVAIMVVGVNSLRQKQWRAFALVFAALIPFVLWTIYSHSCNLISQSALITHPYWDGEKFDKIVTGAWQLLTGGFYHGWTFNAAFLALIANAWFMVKRRDNIYLPLCLVVGLAGYFFILYQVDYRWDTVENVLAYSAKRFLFCFVPIAWYYVASIHPMHQAFRRLENTLALHDRKSSKSVDFQ